MSALKYNLTEGKILSKLLMISLPLMGAQMFSMLHNMVDMFLLGRISSDAVAASGSASMYIWLSISLVIIGSAGAQIGVSQNIGKGQIQEAKTFSNNATFIALVLGLIYGSILFFFTDHLIAFFNIQEAHVNEMAITYLRIIGIGMPFYFVNFTLSATFNGSGNSRIPFFMNGMGLLLNIILNPILIFQLNLGVAGAAIATIIAYMVTCITLLLLIKFYKDRPFKDYKFSDIFKFNKDVFNQIFKWTLPMSLENFVFPALTMIISRVVASYGADAIATQRIGSQVESITWLVGAGFGSAVTTYIGQNFGARKWTRIHDGFKTAGIMMLVYGLFVSLLLFFGAALFFRLFVSETNVIHLGVDYLRIFALIQVFICLEFVCSATFRGLGQTKIPSMISITFNVVRVALVILFSHTNLGLNGVWLGMALGRLGLSLTLLIAYYIKIYKQKDKLPEIYAEGATS